MPAARTCVLVYTHASRALYDANTFQQPVLAVPVHVHAALALYDTDTQPQLVLAVLVCAHAAPALYDADTCQQLVLALVLTPPCYMMPTYANSSYLLPRAA